MFDEIRNSCGFSWFIRGSLVISSLDYSHVLFLTLLIHSTRKLIDNISIIPCHKSREAPRNLDVPAEISLLNIWHLGPTWVGRSQPHVDRFVFYYEDLYEQGKPQEMKAMFFNSLMLWLTFKFWVFGKLVGEASHKAQQ